MKNLSLKVALGFGGKFEIKVDQFFCFFCFKTDLSMIKYDLLKGEKEL